MFEAEAAGLEALAQTQAIRVPKLIACGQTTDHAFLVLEYIALNNLNSRSEQLLGQQLAQLHLQKQPISVGTATTPSAALHKSTATITTGLHSGKSNAWGIN